jgi:hypothetical protein
MAIDVTPEMTKFSERLAEEIRATPGVALKPEDGRAMFSGVAIPQTRVVNKESQNNALTGVEKEKEKEKEKDDRSVVASSGKCQLEQRDKVSDRVLVESSLYRKC